MAVIGSSPFRPHGSVWMLPTNVRRTRPLLENQLPAALSQRDENLSIVSWGRFPLNKGPLLQAIQHCRDPRGADLHPPAQVLRVNGMFAHEQTASNKKRPLLQGGESLPHGDLAHFGRSSIIRSAELR